MNPPARASIGVRLQITQAVRDVSQRIAGAEGEYQDAVRAEDEIFRRYERGDATFQQYEAAAAVREAKGKAWRTLLARGREVLNESRASRGLDPLPEDGT